MGDAERKRLVYVAATRARDHLVVSLHRADHNGGTTAAELLHPVAPPDEALASRFAAAADTGLAGLPPRQVTPPAESHDALHGRLTHARTLSSNPPSTSASGLEGNEPEVALAVAGEEDEPSLTAPPILAKAPRDLDTPSYNKGRDATAIGTAVHAVLQTIDLRTGSGLDALADMQCLAGGIPQHLDLVKDLVRRALASDAVQTGGGEPLLAGVLPRHDDAGRRDHRGLRGPDLPHPGGTAGGCRLQDRPDQIRGRPG